MSEAPDSLAALLTRGALPVAEALRYGIGVAEALREIHSRGRVYGFLQPSGIAVIEGHVRLAPAGPAPISPYYAPEQVLGSDLGPRSDIFALGAVMYEMLSGRQAFSGPTKAALRMEILDREPAPLDTVPPALARIVHKCLEKRPERRVQRMEIVLAAMKLQHILAQQSTPPPPPAASANRASEPRPVIVRRVAQPPAPAAKPAGSRRSPVCPECGSQDVHHSRPQDLFEFALLRSHLSIYRCYRCYHRFVRVAGMSFRKPGVARTWLPPVPKTTSTHKPVA